MARTSVSFLLLVGFLTVAASGWARATETAAPAAAPQAAPATPEAPAAAAQSPWDLLKSGKALASGEGVTKDTAKARAIFEQLMEQDNKQLAGAAALALARLAEEDLKDPALATSALERGIALGDPWSMIRRAQGLAKGGAKDRQKAVDLYLRAKETGTNPDVQKTADYALGELYLTPGLLSAKRALEYHQSAAALGNAWSLMAIGGIYEKGTGIKPNWTRSRDAYLKAYDSGVAEVRGAAALALARLYSQPGHSAPKRAVEYLLVGQQSGNVWATMMLADRYLKGLGVKKSTATARRLYTEIKAGSDQNAAGAAAFQLGRLYSTTKPRNLKLAEENFKFGAAHGDVWSSFFLAQLYLNDMPSKANRRKARELLQGVAKSEDPQARKAATALLKKVR